MFECFLTNVVFYSQFVGISWHLVGFFSSWWLLGWSLRQRLIGKLGGPTVIPLVIEMELRNSHFGLCFIGFLLFSYWNSYFTEGFCYVFSWIFTSKAPLIRSVSEHLAKSLQLFHGKLRLTHIILEP